MAENYKFNEHFLDIESFKKGFNELNSLMTGSMSDLKEYVNLLQQFQKVEKQRQKEVQKSATILQNSTVQNESSLKANSAALKDAAAKMRLYAKESEESAKKQKANTDTQKIATGSIKEMQAQISKLKEEHSELNIETEIGRKDASVYAQKIAQLNEKVKGFRDAMRSTNSEMKVQKGSYVDLIQQNKKLNEEIKKLNPNLATNAKRIKDVQNVINQNTEKLKDFDAKMGRNFRNVGNYKSAFEDLGSTMTGLPLSAGAVGIAFAGITMAVAGFATVMKAGVSASMDFGQQMARVKAISNSTDEQFAQLTKTARDLGASTEFTAVQAGEGLEFLAMAGFSVSDAISTMPALLNLATASQMDLGRSADIVSSIMSGFQLSASESGKAVDILAKTTTTSDTNMENLGEAMKLIAPIASTLKIPLSEMSAAVGIFGDNGLRGSIATQSFGSALLRLSDPTKRQAKAAKELGIELFDNEGRFKGLTNMVAELEKATIGMTDKQKLSTVNQISGAEAAKNFLVLLNAQKKVIVDNTEVTLKGSAALGAYTKNIENSNGASEKMAEIMRSTLTGRIAEFNSALDDVMITIGDELTPAMLEFVKVGLEMITLFKAIATSEEFKTFGGILLDFAKGTLDFMKALNKEFDFFELNTNRLAKVYTKEFDKRPLYEVNLELYRLQGTIKSMLKDEALLNKAIDETSILRSDKLIQFNNQLNSTQENRIRIEKEVAILQETAARKQEQMAGRSPITALPSVDLGTNKEIESINKVANAKKSADDANKKRQEELDNFVSNFNDKIEFDLFNFNSNSEKEFLDSVKKMVSSSEFQNIGEKEQFFLLSQLDTLEQRYSLRERENALNIDEKARLIDGLDLEIQKEKEKLELLKLSNAERILIEESQFRLNKLVADQKEAQLNINRIKAVEGGITNLFLSLENKRIDAMTDVKKQERARYLLQLKQLALEIAFAKIRQRLGDQSAGAEIEGNKNSFITAAIGGLASAFGGFKEGGYTGLGSNFRDNTGDRVAGFVHENEYVVPTNILNNKVASSMVERLDKFKKTKNESYLLDMPKSNSINPNFITQQTIIKNTFTQENAQMIANAISKVLPKNDIQETVNGIIVRQKVGNTEREYLVNAKKARVPNF
jgi:TP901 family phage tail tape measure protein